MSDVDVIFRHTEEIFVTKNTDLSMDIELSHIFYYNVLVFGTRVSKVSF